MTTNLETAIQAALDAGEAIMNIYNTDFEVNYKKDKSPLTEADKKANDIINSYLRKTNIPIISEENDEIDYKTRQHWSQCWIVDPLDGTKEFINRNGEFTVNIALVEEGKPILGVIYIPFSKTLYYGDVLSKNTFKAELSSHNTNLSDVQVLSKSLKAKKRTKKMRIISSRFHMNQETLDFIEQLKYKGNEIEVISKGSSLKFCLIVEGMADIYPRFAPTMEWDTAAGQAICNAIGIDVISQETNKPLLYNKQNLLNPYFITL